MGYWDASNSRAALLCSVSSLALVAVLGGAQNADAAEQAQGIWKLELQGQYGTDETGASQSFTPSSGIPDPSIHPSKGYEGAGKLTFQPTGSPFSYAFGVRYGRSRSVSRNFSDSHPLIPVGTFDQDVAESERLTHTMVDFEVGKDVGLGLFGTGTTTIGGGLRYAHFSDEARGSFATSAKYTRAGQFHLTRSSTLIGPRIFGRTTSPLPGLMGEQGFSLGFGAGAGVLFGRQSAKNDEQLAVGSPGQFVPFSRARQITVPTVDASAQVNWAVPGSPLVMSAGYRYDGTYQVLDGGSAGSSHNINSVQRGPFLAVVLNLD